MPLYALIDGNRQRALRGGPRRASCPECGGEMIAKTGPVRIWHWAHLARNPDCTVAAESEWHLAWKALGPEGSQEIVVGNRRADVLAPGGFAVEFQASALDQEEIGAREGDWAAHGGMAWVFRADQAAIEVTEFFPSRWKPFLKEENLATLKVTWRYAPQRVRAARASSFLDLGNDELLFRRAAEEGPWEKQRTAAPPAGDVLRAVEDLLKTGSGIPSWSWHRPLSFLARYQR